MASFRKKDRYYVVLCEKKNYTQGAFEHSPNGYEKAMAYVKKIERKTSEKYYILEK
jgi:hypothetical protein